VSRPDDDGLRERTVAYLRTGPARLRRVNEQLALWDHLDAMQLMPPSLRLTVQVSVLDGEQLESLRQELIAYLAELEARSDRTQPALLPGRGTCELLHSPGARAGLYWRHHAAIPVGL
jgi:hypothetical protein